MPHPLDVSTLFDFLKLFEEEDDQHGTRKMSALLGGVDGEGKLPGCVLAAGYYLRLVRLVSFWWCGAVGVCLYIIVVRPSSRSSSNRYCTMVYSTARPVSVATRRTCAVVPREGVFADVTITCIDIIVPLRSSFSSFMHWFKVDVVLPSVSMCPKSAANPTRIEAPH